MKVIMCNIIMTAGAFRSLWLKQDANVPFLNKNTASLFYYYYFYKIMNKEYDSGMFLLFSII